MDDYSGVSHSTLSAILRGREPKKPDIRRKLRLPEIREYDVYFDEEGRQIMRER